MKNIVIIGAGDLGKEVVWLIEDINRRSPTYLILGFLDDDIGKTQKEFFGYRVLGTTRQLTELGEKMNFGAVLAIQNEQARRKIVEANPAFREWENIIHPSAVIADSVSYGKGNIFFPQTVCSVDSRMGSFGLYYLHSSVGNDCRIGDYVSVMLNTSVSDHAEIGDGSHLGADTHVPQGAKLGAGTRLTSLTRKESLPELKKLVIIGAGGFGREVAMIAENLNRFVRPTYEILGFLDDGEGFHPGDEIMGYPFLGKTGWAAEHRDEALFVCAIANVAVRARIQGGLTQQGVRFETVVDGDAYVSDRSTLGRGCVVYGGVEISLDCRIGDGVLINSYCTVGHDVAIGDFTTVSPGTAVSGGCTLGTQVNVGGHAYIVPGRKIGDGATVAAGSIVFTNVRAGTTVLGNPARRMKALEND